MKKFFVFICILSVLLMLSACQTDNYGTAESDDTESITAVEKSTTIEKETTYSEEHYYTIEDQTPVLLTDLPDTENNVELFIGEPVTADDLIFTLTGISEFVKQYSPDNITFYDVVNAETYSFLLIYFTLENTGDSPISPSCINLSVISDGERNHSVNRVWHYDADCINLDTAETGAWVATSPKLNPEDGVREGLAVFQLPDSILESDISLELDVNINDKNYTYVIR